MCKFLSNFKWARSNHRVTLYTVVWGKLRVLYRHYFILDIGYFREIPPQLCCKNLKWNSRKKKICSDKDLKISVLDWANPSSNRGSIIITSTVYNYWQNWNLICTLCTILSVISLYIICTFQVLGWTVERLNFINMIHRSLFGHTEKYFYQICKLSVSISIYLSNREYLSIYQYTTGGWEGSVRGWS